MSIHTPGSNADVCEIVRAHRAVRVRGGGSKPALSAHADQAALIDLRVLSGILEYDPGEFTFTARAATPVTEVQAALAGHRQWLPFDPPLAGRGATLGGTLAAGLSGPGSYRNGGLRDFVLGVRLVDGRGRLVAGGGKVVKNAAGFDLPKLMVGGLGRLGVMVELTFKVFPRPEVLGTVRTGAASLEAALAIVRRLSRSTWDIAALDLVGAASGTFAVEVRLGGLARALPDRLSALRADLGSGDVLEGADDARAWEAAREFTWVPPDCALVKVPVTPAIIGALDAAVAPACAARRYGIGGQVAWLAWRGDLDTLDSLLRSHDLAGLLVLGAPVANPILGAPIGGAFGLRVSAALDPDGRFDPRGAEA